MAMTLRAAAMTTVAAALLGGGYFGVQGLGASRAVAASTPEAARPSRVDNFRLTDQDLRSHELGRLSDASAIVLITYMNGCPVLRNSATAMKALKAAYAGKGVEFMMLDSTPQDGREEVAAEVKEYGYDMPVLFDHDQLVGEQLGVTRTAEMIVIDPKTMKVVYRGPLDDRVTYERQKAKAEHSWGADALDALIAKRPISVAEKPAVGCLIDFPHRGEATLSYVKNVAPILESKCVTCHQPGGIGPMPLTSYDKVKAYSPMIREVLRTQRMPPWRADPTVGHFKDDKSLSFDQRRTLVHWIEAGAPRGTGDDPLAMAKHVAPEWPLGKPDLVLDIPAYNIPANGIVDYQRPFVLNPLKDAKWLKASTIKVNNRQSVHHILTGYMAEAPKPGEQAFEMKWGSSMGGYAVGAESEMMPTNVGTYLPPGGAIGFQNHYTPFGKAVEEKSQIALYFYKDNEVPGLVMHNSVIAKPNISIPPNSDTYTPTAYLEFPHEALLYSAFPHAHYRGSMSKLVIRYPDGKEKLLLSLPKYDFNWQRDYNFAEPIKVPAGTKLIASFTYDNTKRNAANPDPNRTVPWGDQSFDEMFYMAVRYRWVDETSAKQLPAYEQALKDNRMMGIFDTNMDGKIEQAELTGQMGEGLKKNFAMIDRNKDGVIDNSELAVVQAMMGRRGRKTETAGMPTTPTKTSEASPPKAVTVAAKGS